MSKKKIFVLFSSKMSLEKNLIYVFQKPKTKLFSIVSKRWDAKDESSRDISYKRCQDTKQEAHIVCLHEMMTSNLNTFDQTFGSDFKKKVKKAINSFTSNVTLEYNNFSLKSIFKNIAQNWIITKKIGFCFVLVNFYNNLFPPTKNATKLENLP